MSKTLRDIDTAIEKYAGLTLFLAGVRATVHELASIGKEHYKRADKAEQAITTLKATIKAISILQRYEIDADYNCRLEIDEDKEGDWVRFEDVIKLTGADQ